MKMKTRRLYPADSPLVVAPGLKLGLFVLTLNTYNIMQIIHHRIPEPSLMGLGCWGWGRTRRLSSQAWLLDLVLFFLQKVVSGGLSCLGCRDGTFGVGSPG